MAEYKPDGSGTVIIRICDSEGNLVKTQYCNLSDVAVKEDDNGNSEQ